MIIISAVFVQHYGLPFLFFKFCLFVNVCRTPQLVDQSGSKLSEFAAPDDNRGRKLPVTRRLARSALVFALQSTFADMLLSCTTVHVLHTRSLCPVQWCALRYK